ncbi:uncharacterized protein DS421_8g249890 [Arachis hypogaea]|nr:uncharacterized protein DS421_8g249890 [Arachis hypogaea]
MWVTGYERNRRCDALRVDVRSPLCVIQPCVRSKQPYFLWGSASSAALIKHLINVCNLFFINNLES